MKKKTSNLMVTLLIVALAVFACAQFVPYFTYGADRSVSLASYIWFPYNHDGLTDHISSQAAGYSINGILVSAIFLPVAAVALIALLRKYRDSAPVLAASGLWGVWGLIGYGANAALRMGNSTWLAFMVLFAAVFLLSAACLLSRMYTHKEAREASDAKSGMSETNYAMQ